MTSFFQNRAEVHFSPPSHFDSAEKSSGSTSVLFFNCCEIFWWEWLQAWQALLLGSSLAYSWFLNLARNAWYAKNPLSTLMQQKAEKKLDSWEISISFVFFGDLNTLHLVSIGQRSRASRMMVDTEMQSLSCSNKTWNTDRHPRMSLLIRKSFSKLSVR